MTDDKTAELIKKYPQIFTKNFYLECGDGWFDLINELCFKLQAYIDDFDSVEQVIAGQVKEKFGGLRFYIDQGGDDYIYSLIKEAEHQSHKTCEDCGSPGKVQNHRHWLMCRCPTCFAKSEKAFKTQTPT
jgi:hypothetical protein